MTVRINNSESARVGSVGGATTPAAADPIRGSPQATSHTEPERAIACPEGTPENSPAFQRRGAARPRRVPKGRLKPNCRIQPSLWDLAAPSPNPALKRRAIVKRPSRTPGGCSIVKRPSRTSAVYSRATAAHPGAGISSLLCEALELNSKL